MSIVAILGIWCTSAVVTYFGAPGEIYFATILATLFVVANNN